MEFDIYMEVVDSATFDIDFKEGSSETSATKTSDLYNDGDGISPFATEEYVSEEISKLSTINYHICSVGEYNQNGVPTVENPTKNIFYLVPSGESSPNLFIEWHWVEEQWERFGSASIDLTNYVKNTDYALQNGNYGLVKLGNINNGLEVKNDGQLYLVAQNNFDRGSSYKIIPPSKIDGWVKEVLSNYNEGWGGKWTSQQQENARNLLGIENSDKWRIIQNITLSEDTHEIIFNQDSNGNPFNLKKARITIKGTSTVNRLDTKVENCTNVYFYNLLSANNPRYAIYTIGENINGLRRVSAIAYNPSDTAYILANNSQEFTMLTNSSSNSFSSIEITFGYPEGDLLAGAEIIFEGVDYNE